MDKFEYKVRADEIKELIQEGNYAEAAEIADTIDWRRIKSVMVLCMISDLYKKNQRYEDAKNILLMAYDKRAGGRSICYSLCELCLKTGDFVEAIDYYKEFIEIAPNDSGRYILQYKILEVQDVALEERIEVLEQLKAVEHREKWMYELAYLYHRIGEATRCVEECDEIYLWFGEGKYVMKALELKSEHCDLPKEQQEKLDEYLKAIGKLSSDTGVSEKETTSEEEKTEVKKAVSEPHEEADVTEAEAVKVVTPEPVEESAPTEEVTEIRVEPLGEGDFNSIRLEQELAAGLQEVLAETQEKKEPVFEIVEPMEEDSVEDDLQLTKIFGQPIEEQKEVEIVYEEQRNMVQVYPELREALESSAQMPLDLERVLSQESDGQIRLVVPEEEVVEKQITGQMNLDDILAEWEMMKLQNEKRQREEVRRRVLQQTGAIFTEFEESIKDGLLERLEKAPLETVEEKKVSVDPNWDEEEPEAEIEVEEIEVEEIEAEAEPEVEEVYEEEEVEAEAEPEVEEVYEEEEVEAEAEPEVEEVYGEEEAEVEAEPEIEEAYEEEEVEAEAEPEAEEVYEAEMPAVRGLTTEEKAMYGTIIQGKEARENLAQVIDQITVTPGVGNLILAGDDGRDTMAIAKNLIRQLQMAEPAFVGKVAKITGEGMNNRDALETVAIFDKGALIIQSASGMEESTAFALCEALSQESAEIFVVLEDTAKGIEWLLGLCPELGESFTTRIDAETLTNDKLIEYAISYAKDNEFSIDQMGILALHSKVEALQTLDHAVTVEEVKEIMDEAIARASKKSVGHFMDVLFAKRYDKDDMIIITEKDFA